MSGEDVAATLASAPQSPSVRLSINRRSGS